MPIVDRMEKMMSDMRGMMMRGGMGPATEKPGKEGENEAPKAEPHKHTLSRIQHFNWASGK